MANELIRMKTGSIGTLGEKDENGNPRVSLNAGTIYFAVDTTNNIGKIVYDVDDGNNGTSRIVMSTQAEVAEYDTNGGRIVDTYVKKEGDSIASLTVTDTTNNVSNNQAALKVAGGLIVERNAFIGELSLGVPLAVSEGGTGVRTFASGEALIGNGTNGVITRAITNITTPSSAVTANENLITANTLNNFAGSGSTNIVGTITTGTWEADVVEVPFGGTGRNTLSANAVLTGNGTDPVNLVSTASGALYATVDNGAPVFGTLPVEQGGTGLTTSTYENAIITGNTEDATDSFATIRTQNGAFFATGEDAQAQFGILPVAQGGTGVNSFNDGEVLISGTDNNNNQTIITRAIKDLTVAEAVSNESDKLITERAVYYATANINNGRQSSNVSIFAPTTSGNGGTNDNGNLILASAGTDLAPVWKKIQIQNHTYTKPTGELTGSLIITPVTATIPAWTFSVENEVLTIGSSESSSTPTSMSIVTGITYTNTLGVGTTTDTLGHNISVVTPS